MFIVKNKNENRPLVGTLRKEFVPLKSGILITKKREGASFNLIFFYKVEKINIIEVLVQFPTLSKLFREEQMTIDSDLQIPRGDCQIVLTMHQS